MNVILKKRNIQLSSWLFCEITRQLCPCLTASSCYFKTSYTMHLLMFRLRFSLAYNVWRTLSRLRQADFRSPTTHWWPLMAQQTSHWRQELHVHAQHCIYNRYRKQFLTDRLSDSRTLLLQPLWLPLYVSRTRKQNWSNTYSITSCTQRCSWHTIPAQTSPCNSAWSFSAFPPIIILSCLDIHSTTTV